MILIINNLIKNNKGRTQDFVQEGFILFISKGAKQPLGPKTLETIDFTDPGGGTEPISPPP